MMKTWLVIWGDDLDKIRMGEGPNEAAAMRSAYGDVASNMTAMPVNRADTKVHKRRMKMQVQLLNLHGVHLAMGAGRYEQPERMQLIAKINAEITTICAKYPDLSQIKRPITF